MELKPIPGTLGFLADSEGNIYDQTLAKRNIYRNGDGYVTTNVLTDDGWETIGVHRLVAMAFHGLPKEGFDHVNHLDCNIENNRANNVEWVSIEQNNIHAEIFRKDNHRPCILAINNEYWSYPSWYLNVWEASSKIPCFSPFDIWHAIKNKETIEDPVRGDSWHFSFLKQSDNIPKSLQKDRIPEDHPGGTLPKRAVKVRDIDSDVVMTFDSIATAAKHFDVGGSAIHQAIPQRDVVRIFKKKYQIAYADEEFLEMTEEDWARAKNTGPRDVVAYNHVEDKFYFFQSGVAFIEHSKLSKKAVTTSLAKGKLRKIGDWTAMYYEGENFRMLIDHVKGSSPDVIVSVF